MSKFDECVAKYEAEMTKLGVKYDADLLRAVAKGCGPSIYNADASKVSSADKDELDRVKTNFLGKKLGVTDEAKADAAIAKVVDIFGSSNRNKFRAIFYYLLVKEFGKEEVYS